MADVSDSRQKDPVRTLQYRLTRQDAVAYSILRHQLTRGEKFKVILLVGGAGVIATSLPQHWPALWWWASVAGIMICASFLALAWTNLYARRGGASLQVPNGPVTLEEWDDRLVERSEKSERTVPLDKISEVIATPQRLFLCIGKIPVIVPRAAFSDVNEMAAFAERAYKASVPVVS